MTKHSPDWAQIEAARDRAAAIPESDWTPLRATKPTRSTRSSRLESQRNSLYQLLNRRANP